MDARRTGSFIAELRKEQGLTQKQLAEKLFVSDKAVSRWEAAHGMPGIDNLEALSAVLGVGVAELLRGERINAPLPSDEAEELASGGLSLVRGLLKRRTANSILIGFLASLVVLALAVVHLLSPLHMAYEKGLVRVDELSDGTLVAIARDDVAGIDVNMVENEAFVGCYTTRLHQIMGSAGSPAAVLGNRDAIRNVRCYPGTAGDVLIYGESDGEGVVTLPRLVYNMWLALALAAGVAGLAAWALLRKRWYAPHILKAALAPICLGTSIAVVLWGRFGEVYDAPFYLSGILLVALALYAIALLVLSRTAQPN